MRKQMPHRMRLAACATAAAMALPASADIGAFNAAVKAGDFKKAAAEAAATWPTLDQSRPDIAVIAREFGFASYIGGDYSAAQTFALAAVSKQTGDAAAADDLLVSTVLLGLASHRVKPSVATRDKLFEALTARVARPGLDNISYLGTDSLVAFDFEKGRWKEAQVSAHLAVDLTTHGGPAYLLNRRKYELYAGIADYMATRKPEIYDNLEAVQEAMLGDMQRANDDAAAAKFAPLYWEVTAWSDSLHSHLLALRKLRPEKKSPDEIKAEHDRIWTSYPRAMGLLHGEDNSEVCKRKLEIKPMLEYPSSAFFAGFVGTVIVQVDIDAQGWASNPRILAAVPEKDFAKTVLKGVDRFRYVPGEGWDASKCSLEDKGRVITVSFQIPF